MASIKQDLKAKLKLTIANTDKHKTQTVRQIERNTQEGTR